MGQSNIGSSYSLIGEIHDTNELFYLKTSYEPTKTKCVCWDICVLTVNVINVQNNKVEACMQLIVIYDY